MRDARLVHDPDDPRWVRGFYKPVGGEGAAGHAAGRAAGVAVGKRVAWLRADIESTVMLAKAFGVRPNIGKEAAEHERLTDA